MTDRQAGSSSTSDAHAYTVKAGELRPGIWWSAR